MHKVEITCDQLEVRYDSLVALSAEQEALSGGVIGIIGHNGAGKSTLIKTLLGLLRPKSGTIATFAVNDTNKQLLIPKQHMAFCPETGAVFGDISVESYIRLWCEFKQYDRKFYRKAGSEYIERLNITPLLSKLGRQLSKGECRRVQTAIGFLIQPKLLVFDEPFDGLDVQKTQELADIILDHSQKMAFIITSHRMDVMERLADALIVLRNGKFAATGKVADVCEKLCDQSLVVSHASDSTGLMSALKQRYSNCVVNQVGNQITLSGNQIDPKEVAGFVGSFETNGIRIDQNRPCLIDAMSFHLREIERSG